MTARRAASRGLAAAAILVALAAPARAQSDAGEAPPEGARQPLAWVLRPLTLPGLTARGDFRAEMFRVPNDVGIANVVGAGFGVLDDLQVDAVFAPVQYTPEVSYGYPSLSLPALSENPSIAITYRFAGGDFELGARVRALVPAAENTEFTMAGSLPMRVHIGDFARFDASVDFAMITGPRPVPVLSAPLAFGAQVIDPIHLGILSGFQIIDFDDRQIGVPFGGFGGFAVEGAEGPVADLGVSVTWPAFFTPTLGRTVQTEVYVVTAGVSGFLYL